MTKLINMFNNCVSGKVSLMGYSPVTDTTDRISGLIFEVTALQL